jgi:hypothetical protein
LIQQTFLLSCVTVSETVDSDQKPDFTYTLDPATTTEFPALVNKFTDVEQFGSPGIEFTSLEFKFSLEKPIKRQATV